MSVFCTNSGNTYASLPELVTAEATLHVGEVVIELSGSNTGDVTFTAQDFDSVKIVAAAGEEFDPTTSTGAIHTGKITATCPLIIDGTRVYDISVVYPTAQILNSEFGGAGNVGLTYGTSNNVYAYNCVIHDTYRGSYATGANPNATLENCTLYNNSNLGLLRCNCINTVVIDCAGTDYFSAVSQVNTWGDDASAQNIVTEGYATFVDFASGDVRIRADSDAGLAGAGAFIEESAAVSVDVFPTISSFTSQVLNPSINIFNDINIEEDQTYTSYSVVSPDISIGFDISLSPNSALYNTIVNNPVIVQEVDTNILDSGSDFLSDVFSPTISINNDVNLDDVTTTNSSNVYNPLVGVEVDVYIPATFPTHYSTTFNPDIIVQEDSELYEDSVSFNSNSYKPSITIGTDLNITPLTTTLASVVYKDSIALDTSVEDRVVNNICTLHSPEINILEDIYVVSEANDNIFNTYRDTITIGITPYISSYTLSYRKLNTRASYRNLNYSIKYRNK